MDVIDGLAGSRQIRMMQSSEWNLAESSCCSTGSPCSTTAILESVCRSVVFDRLDRYLRFPMPTAEFSRDFIGLLYRIVILHEPATSELLDWFEWTRYLRIHGRSLEDILQDSSQQHASETSSDVTPNMDEYQQETFYGRFFDTVVRLSYWLMVSRSGRMGMVGEGAIKGALVCVLYGCSVPVLMRKCCNGGDSYTLVGECYLDGCMDGSLMDKAGLEERIFTIQ